MVILEILQKPEMGNNGEKGGTTRSLQLSSCLLFTYQFGLCFFAAAVAALPRRSTLAPILELVCIFSLEICVEEEDSLYRHRCNKDDRQQWKILVVAVTRTAISMRLSMAIRADHEATIWNLPPN